MTSTWMATTVAVRADVVRRERCVAMFVDGTTAISPSIASSVTFFPPLGKGRIKPEPGVNAGVPTPCRAPSAGPARRGGRASYHPVSTTHSTSPCEMTLQLSIYLPDSRSERCFQGFALIVPGIVLPDNNIGGPGWG